jgi:hypothetical protein
MEQNFNRSLLTGFGPSKLMTALTFEELTPGFDCGGGTYKVTREEAEKFRKLMGDTNSYKLSVAPVGMIYIFGLRICWDRKVFIDGSIRAGDKITFHKPAKIGDTITTRLSIADKKEVTKDDKVRRYLYIDMNATNQNDEKITDIQMSFLMPVKK